MREGGSFLRQKAGLIDVLQNNVGGESRAALLLDGIPLRQGRFCSTNVIAQSIRVAA